MFHQNGLILMELGNLAIIKISSPQANGPFEPKNVKISLKLTELQEFKGRFSEKKVLVGFHIKHTSTFLKCFSPETS